MTGTGLDTSATAMARHYELVRVLGIGGMAEVLLVRALDGPQEGRLVALKRLLLSRSEERAFLRSLINEARVASQLYHPGIVQTYGFEVIDQRYCLVMEYIDGITLEDALNCCRINAFYPPFSLMAYIMAQVCVALDYLHFARSEDGQPLKLVHRDIKPSNIMLCSDGQVKLLDFGVAKATNSLYNTTAGMGAKGTLAFMSPEQLAGGEITGASDLFSLGTSFYESIALDPLFDDRNLAKLTQDLYLGLQLEAAYQIRRLMPAAEPILSRLLQARPEERYPSALAAKQAFDALSGDHSPRSLAEWIARVQTMPGYASGLSTATSESARETASSLVPGTILYSNGAIHPSRAMAELLGPAVSRSSRMTETGARTADSLAQTGVSPASSSWAPGAKRPVGGSVSLSAELDPPGEQSLSSGQSVGQQGVPREVLAGLDVSSGVETNAAAASATGSRAKPAWSWWGGTPNRKAQGAGAKGVGAKGAGSKPGLQERVLLFLSGVVLSGLLVCSILLAIVDGG